MIKRAVYLYASVARRGAFFGHLKPNEAGKHAVVSVRLQEMRAKELLTFH